MSSTYPNPGKKLFSGLARCYVASKAGGVVLPHAMDIHPVSGHCNMDCDYCIGRADRQNISPLPNRLDRTGMIVALEKVLDSRWRKYWPSEFHFCGCDSEPLLNNAVLPAIEFLLERKRIVELVTNGLLLSRGSLLPVVAQISKLSISLDVTNNNDYAKIKHPSSQFASRAYSTVLNNIKAVTRYRKQLNSKLRIAVTFVATELTYDKVQWEDCFRQLSDAGVTEVRVRDDLTGTFGSPINGLKSDIRDIDSQLSSLDVKFISPDKSLSGFKYCRAARLWPALGADGCLYPCAHTATTEYQPFADLLGSVSLYELYTDVFQPPKSNFLEVDTIGCGRRCPSVLGRFNERKLAMSMVGAKYV